MAIPAKNVLGNPNVTEGNFQVEIEKLRESVIGSGKAYDSANTYMQYDTCVYSGVTYYSKINSNTGNTPSIGAIWGDIADLISSVVHKTDDETIAGVKTFSSSPIVPTPTTGTQAVNKDYADLKVALASFVGTNQSISNNGYQKIPGGFIIQWGLAPSTVQGGMGTNIFPVSFPGSCLSIILTDYALIENLSVIWAASFISKNYFNYHWSIGASGIGASPARTPFYIAIGY